MLINSRVWSEDYIITTLFSYGVSLQLGKIFIRKFVVTKSRCGLCWRGDDDTPIITIRLMLKSD